MAFRHADFTGWGLRTGFSESVNHPNEVPCRILCAPVFFWEGPVEFLRFLRGFTVETRGPSEPGPRFPLGKKSQSGDNGCLRQALRGAPDCSIGDRGGDGNSSHPSAQMVKLRAPKRGRGESSPFSDAGGQREAVICSLGGLRVAPPPLSPSVPHRWVKGKPRPPRSRGTQGRGEQGGGTRVFSGIAPRLRGQNGGPQCLAGSVWPSQRPPPCRHFRIYKNKGL